MDVAYNSNLILFQLAEGLADVCRIISPLGPSIDSLLTPLVFLNCECGLSDIPWVCTAISRGVVIVSFYVVSPLANIASGS